MTSAQEAGTVGGGGSGLHTGIPSFQTPVSGMGHSIVHLCIEILNQTDFSKFGLYITICVDALGIQR